MKATFLLCTLTFFATVAQAQIVQPVNRFTNASTSETNNEKAVMAGEEAKGATLLPQAGAQAVGSDNTQIGLQALDLWITKRWRLYARLTLPTKAEAATKSGSGESSATPSDKTPVKLSDSIVRQLVDPYGGVFNLSGGIFSRMIGWRREEMERTARVDRLGANLERVAEQTQLEHGLFFDGRGGFKFIDLPSPGESAVAVSDRKFNVFYSGIVGVKLIAPLYDDPSLNDSDLAGGLTLGVYVVGNYAADPAQSPLIGTSLKRGTSALTGVIGLNISSVAAVTFSITPATNDDRMGKTFIFGFNVLRPVKEPTPQSTGQPRGLL